MRVRVIGIQLYPISLLITIYSQDLQCMFPETKNTPVGGGGGEAMVRSRGRDATLSAILVCAS